MSIHSHPTTTSRRLARAAQAERADLAKRRARLQAQRDAAAAKLQELDDALLALDDHERLVAALAAPAAPTPVAEPAQAAGISKRLRGPSIRRVATKLLAEDAKQPAVHYRDWYEQLRAAGYEVEGKDPLAVFLTQLSRSPVVRRSTQAGVYEIDHDALARLRAERVRLEREMRELLSSEGSDLTTIRAKREELTREVGQVERALEEAAEVLASPQKQVHAQ